MRRPPVLGPNGHSVASIGWPAPSPQDRLDEVERAAKTFQENQDPRARDLIMESLPRLKEALESAIPARRESAAAAVGAVAGCSGEFYGRISDLFLAAMKDPGVSVRSRAAKAFAEQLYFMRGALEPYRSAVPAMETALRDADPWVRGSAAKALGHLGGVGTTEAFSALVRTMGDAHYVTRQTATISLGKYGPRAVAPLLRALKEGDDRVRSCAAYALESAGVDPGVGPRLRRRVVHALQEAEAGDRASGVRESATDAWKRILIDTGPLPKLDPPPSPSPWALRMGTRSAHLTAPQVPLGDSEEITIEAWVLDWRGGILCLGMSGDPENSIWISTGNRAMVGVGSESCGFESVSGTNYEVAPGTGMPGEWTHVAMVYVRGTLRVYLQGELAGTMAAPRPGPFLAKRDLVLGAHLYETLNPGQGFLGPVRISSTARYSKDFTPDSGWKTDDRTLFLLPLLEGGGAEAKDATSHGRHATLRGAEWVRTDTLGSSRPLERVTRVGGRGGGPFEDVAPRGGLLVGLRATIFTLGDRDIIKSLVPLYRVREASETGRAHGHPSDRVLEILARPDYAIGGLVAEGGDRVNGFRAIFMRVTPDGLDPKDRYEGEWIGGRSGGPEVALGEDGVAVIGISGRDGADLDALSLVLDPHAARDVSPISLGADGFLSRWLILGPIPLGGMAWDDPATLLKEWVPKPGALTPEQHDTVTVEGVDYFWRAGVAADAFLSLGATENSVSIAVCAVFAESDLADARLLTGSDDSALWFLNGLEVQRFVGGRGVDRDQDRSAAPVTLKKGANRVVAVVANGEGPTAACARFVDAAGRPLPLRAGGETMPRPNLRRKGPPRDPGLNATWKPEPDVSFEEKRLAVVPPDNSGGREISYQFQNAMFSPDGRSVAYLAHSSYPSGTKYSVVLGEKRGEEFDSCSNAFVWSPDGTLLAYGAQREGKGYFILGDRRVRAGDMAGPALFSSDGKTLAYTVMSNEGKTPRYSLVVGGETVEGYDEIDPPSFGPDGRIHFLATKDGKRMLVLGGSKSEAFDRIGAGRFALLFGADGKTPVYAAQKDGAWFVVVGDRKSEGFESIAFGPFLGSDGKTVAYAARKDGKTIVVVGDQRSGPYDDVMEMRLCDDGKNVWYTAVQDGKSILVVGSRRFTIPEQRGLEPAVGPDGKTVVWTDSQGGKVHVVVGGRKGESFDVVTALTIGPDGQSVAYVAANGDLRVEPGTWFMVVGEKKWKARGNLMESVLGRVLKKIILSHDGKTFAYVMSNGGKQSLVVEDKKGEDFEHIASVRGDDLSASDFAPDGKSLVYIARKGGSGTTLVVGDQKGEAFGGIKLFTWSPGAKTYAYAGIKDGKECVVVGRQRSEDCDWVGQPVFSADGRKLAFPARQGRELWWKVIEVKP